MGSYLLKLNPSRVETAVHNTPKLAIVPTIVTLGLLFSLYKGEAPLCFVAMPTNLAASNAYRKK